MSEENEKLWRRIEQLESREKENAFLKEGLDSFEMIELENTDFKKRFSQLEVALRDLKKTVEELLS